MLDFEPINESSSPQLPPTITLIEIPPALASIAEVEPEPLLDFLPFSAFTDSEYPLYFAANAYPSPLRFSVDIPAPALNVDIDSALSYTATPDSISSFDTLATPISSSFYASPGINLIDATPPPLGTLGLAPSPSAWSAASDGFVKPADVMRDPFATPEDMKTSDDEGDEKAERGAWAIFDVDLNTNADVLPADLAEDDEAAGLALAIIPPLPPQPILTTSASRKRRIARREDDGETAADARATRRVKKPKIDVSLPESGARRTTRKPPPPGRCVSNRLPPSSRPIAHLVHRPSPAAVYPRPYTHPTPAPASQTNVVSMAVDPSSSRKRPRFDSLDDGASGSITKRRKAVVSRAPALDLDDEDCADSDADDQSEPGDGDDDHSYLPSRTKASRVRSRKQGGTPRNRITAAVSSGVFTPGEPTLRRDGKIGCTGCPDKTFKRYPDAQRHVDTTHCPLRPYMCTTCCTTFSRSSCRRTHWWRTETACVPVDEVDRQLLVSRHERVLPDAKEKKTLRREANPRFD
ncbi:hypothetical protein EXIGLDRAFT_749987 [Exidia glandulosa HHB12029]|uniref:Uncharacterized protein n=1 Tax=Exidia glandulosa HHB12029 TaxID=1314781 RepID=A0A165HCM1_EXIGL|nr:hypothetical protein EXIGLDRAFT_749987 [Exidia glandulosa HHB12029]